MRAGMGLAGIVMLILALGIVEGRLPGGLALAQALPTDLTGETCTGDTKEIDGRTYCVMNGRLPDCEAIEIDDLDNDVTTFPDANLTSGAEPNHKDLPPIGLCQGGTEDKKVCDPAAPTACNAGGGNCVNGLTSCTEAVVYKDWANLPITNLSPDGGDPIGSVEDHRILDWTAANDNTSLHGECLTDGSVHAKEDFTQSYLANNERFLYFAQERRTNKGNSTFYWLLTHEAPIIDTSTCTTGADRGEVLFKLSSGDVRVVVAFSGSGGITLFTNSFSGSTTGYLPPKGTMKNGSDGAVFNPGWLGFQKPVVNLALVSAGDGDDGFAPWGGIDNQGQIETGAETFESGELAEWAVDLRDVFPGGGNLCGEELFVTGISRAATGDPDKITESSDLKDIIGPKLFSFGAISNVVTLTPETCGDSFDYKVETKDASGNTIVPDKITWSCTTDGNPVTMDTMVAMGTATVPPKSDRTPTIVTCDVTVKAGGCEDTVEDQVVKVDAKLVAITAEIDPILQKCCTPGLVGVCQGNVDGMFTLKPDIKGGSGSYFVDWVFKPDIGISCERGPSCTVDVPDSIACAAIGVSITVTDAVKPACVIFEQEYGFIKKATILQFQQQFNQSFVACNPVTPPAPACVSPMPGPPIVCH